MDATIPREFAGAMKLPPKKRRKKAAGYSLRWKKQEFPVIELTASGFVIAADAPPPLGGFTDIFEGPDRILRGLATCAWARDGLVGYEFKHGTPLGPIRVDHISPDAE